MRIGVVTIFPEIFRAVSEAGITRVAMQSGAVDLELFNPRDYCEDRYRAVDDRPYGGGPGMVMKPEPLARCIDHARSVVRGPVVFLTPQGDRLDQARVRDLSELPAVILLAGRYEDIDERIVRSRVDQEFGPGDQVRVQVRVKEGSRERLQAYEGVVIAKKNRGLNSSFTVRKIASGEGVERVFQTHSPLIAEIEVVRRGDVRRAKLYYLRERSGKAARIKEKVRR